MTNDDSDVVTIAHFQVLAARLARLEERIAEMSQGSRQVPSPTGDQIADYAMHQALNKLFLGHIEKMFDLYGWLETRGYLVPGTVVTFLGGKIVFKAKDP